MQPFSLLPFLQSLIQNLPSDTSAEPSTISAEKPPPSSPVHNEVSNEKNACWEFISRHDERVKRTKKGS